MNDVHAGRLSLAINRLENLVKEKQAFIERVQTIVLPRIKGAVVHDRAVAEVTQAEAEILQIQAAIHDIRYVREAA